MRIWSVHPRYLDRQGLTAGWREGLLAQKVLTGATKGYRNHPQLRRFRAAGDGAAMDADPDPDPDGDVTAAGGSGRGGPARIADDGGSGAHVAPAPGLAPGRHAPGTTVDVVPPAVAGPAISTYLHALVDEAAHRGYRFDRALVLGAPEPDLRLEVTDQQLVYEWEHLLAKLAVRSPDTHALWKDVTRPDPHPLFRVVEGPVAEWEIVTVGEQTEAEAGGAVSAEPSDANAPPAPAG